MFLGDRAANITREQVRASDQALDASLFKTHARARAANTVSGAWAITASSARAGPRGMRLPCSQLRMVSTGTPSRAANSCCVRRARRRRSRTTGEVAIPGVTVLVTGVAEVLAGANDIERASGNSRPSRSSTIRSVRFQAQALHADSTPGMIGDVGVKV